MVIGQLICNSVQCIAVDKGVKINSKCPLCGFDWTETVNLSQGNLVDGTFEFNNQITMAVPEHVNSETQESCLFSGEVITFYLAVHCLGEDLKVFVQRSDADGSSGIPLDWWRNP
jgi:hypothetical protein